MSLMLTSVSDISEAELALSCEVDWLDIKDPRAGALGRADTEVVSAIARMAMRRLPVSATVGDTWDEPALIPAAVKQLAATGVDYAKVGLRARAISAVALNALADAVACGPPIIVVCLAEDPPAANDRAALAAVGVAGVMLDTADKSGRRLIDLLSVEELRAFVNHGRELGLLTGLAGRLRLGDIASLLPCAADYLGFRSALCAAGQREARMTRAAVMNVRGAMPRHASAINKIANEVA